MGVLKVLFARVFGIERKMADSTFLALCPPRVLRVVLTLDLFYTALASHANPPIWSLELPPAFPGNDIEHD